MQGDKRGFIEDPDEKSCPSEMTAKLVGQVKKMAKALDPELYSPTYSHAVIDSSEGPGSTYYLMEH